MSRGRNGAGGGGVLSKNTNSAERLSPTYFIAPIYSRSDRPLAILHLCFDPAGGRLEMACR